MDIIYLARYHFDAYDTKLLGCYASVETAQASCQRHCDEDYQDYDGSKAPPLDWQPHAAYQQADGQSGAYTLMGFFIDGGDDPVHLNHWKTACELAARPYAVTLEQDGADVIATHVLLPGCVAVAATETEARALLDSVRRDYLYALLCDDIAVPPVE